MYYVTQKETLVDQMRKRIGGLRRAAPAARTMRAARRGGGWRTPGWFRLPAAMAGSSWLPLLAATAVTIGLFLVVLPRLEPSWLTGMLLNRGPVQPVTVAVAIMGLFSIAQRAVSGIRERRAANDAAHWAWPDMAMQPRQAQTWVAVTAGTGHDWLATRLARLAGAVAGGEPASMACDRLEQADRRAVQELHQLPRVTLSALPLLGLGGTVLGLSGGMGKLSGFIEGASDLASLRAVLTGFSGSLATAFDATLLALALMAPLLVLAGLVRGRDELTLRQIDSMAERLGSLIVREAQPGVDEAVVQRAAGNVVAAVDRGIGEIFARLERRAAAEPGQRMAPDVVMALADLPRALDAVRDALAEPRAVDIRVGAAPPNAKEA